MGRSHSREGGARSSDEGDIGMQRCTRQIGRIIFVALVRSSVETSLETLLRRFERGVKCRDVGNAWIA